MQVTKEELAQWADEEGGWANFMHQGVGEDDVPMEIRAAWVDVINAYDDFERALDRLKAKL